MLELPKIAELCETWNEFDFQSDKSFVTRGLCKSNADR